MTEKNNYSGISFADGLKAGVPIAVGYLPIAVTFGLLAGSAGIPSHITAMMSLLIFAGASQFVGVNLMALGTSHWEIILTTFILNLRHFLMTASISRRIKHGTPKGWMALLSFGVTDETFTVASLRRERELGPGFVLGLNLIAFSAWNIGTWMGTFLGAGLPEQFQASMGIALYAMFIGLLVPSMRTSIKVLVIAVLAMAIHSLLHWLPLFGDISTGWGIITATVLASAVGAFFYRGEEETIDG